MNKWRTDQNPKTSTSIYHPEDFSRFYVPGLDIINKADRFLILGTSNLPDVSVGFEATRRASFQPSGNLYAVEKIKWGCKHQYSLEIYDSCKVSILQLNSLKVGCASCCASFVKNATVISSEGKLVGLIKRKRNFFSSYYTIRNMEGEIEMKVKGPTCVFGNQVVFKFFLSKTNTEIGRVVKIGNAPNIKKICEITVDQNLELRIKLLILGTFFLIVRRK